ncbi:hypothetical protein GQ53DRAFT_748504 [Thozetella sp. PMI_491]|nr:hypothetical protein GQ53DRAFT_748504 [Thozetella sp. PMI_491]
MNLKGPSPEAECRTWSLELFGAPITIPVRIALRDPVRWRRIACPPASLETLAVTITFLNQRTKFSNRSGPTEITRHLYQALNQILHYGPLLTRRSPLPEPLKINTLVVQVAIDQSLQPVIPALDSRWFLRIPASEFHALCDLVDVLESTGLLWGYVERIRIMDEDGIYEEFEISRMGNAGVPKRWDSYGFDWGPIEGEPLEAAKAA